MKPLRVPMVMSRHRFGKHGFQHRTAVLQPGPALSRLEAEARGSKLSQRVQLSEQTARALTPAIAALGVGSEILEVRSLVAPEWAPSRPPSVNPECFSRAGTNRVIVACSDVTGHNGQIRVLRRGTAVRSPFAPSDSADLITIPLAAGDALVLAPDIAMGAYPNHSPEPRVLLELIVGPPGSAPIEESGQRSLAGVGYEQVDLLDRSQVSAVRAVVDSLDLADGHAFFTSPKDANGSRARSADLQIREVVQSAAVAQWPGYLPFMVAVTSKGRRTGGPVHFHQDWTYVDERDARAVFLWCPLVDASSRNGGLSVVEASHLWVDRIRPSRVFPLPVATEPHQDEYRSLAVDLEVQAGSAVMFDPALLHGSSANPTDEARPAITIALAPADMQLVHFHEDPDGVLTGHEVDEAFFTTAPFRARPEGYSQLTPWARALATADLEGALRAHSPAGPLRESGSTSDQAGW